MTYPDRGLTFRIIAVPEGTHVNILSAGDGASSSSYSRVAFEMLAPACAITAHMWHCRIDQPENCSALRENCEDEAPVSTNQQLHQNERVVILQIKDNWAKVQTPTCATGGWARLKHLKTGPPQEWVTDRSGCNSLVEFPAPAGRLVAAKPKQACGNLRLGPGAPPRAPGPRHWFSRQGEQPLRELRVMRLRERARMRLRSRAREPRL